LHSQEGVEPDIIAVLVGSVIPMVASRRGTAWAEMPDGWVCPVCGAGKPDFREIAWEPGQHPPNCGPQKT
jgi:hypothetical protein